MNDFFGFSVTDDLDNYGEEISMYQAVREHFGFREHYRDLDWYCHWAQEESEIYTWFHEHDISNRTVWQINAGQSTEGWPEELWPVWNEREICSIGWDVGDLSELTDKEIEEAAEKWEGSEVANYLKRISREIQSGQIVIAKDGFDLLGIGVTKDDEYRYMRDVIKEEIGLHHPHAWPVEWIVQPETIDTNTGNWDLSTGLQHRSTLLGTAAFEHIRLKLSQENPSLIEPLSDVESRVGNPAEVEESREGEIAAVSDTAPYYWVNQGQAEIDGEFLQAPTKERFQYDLPKLAVGDLVFSYSEGEVIGFHEVRETARIIEISVENESADDSKEESLERYRVETEFNHFEEPLEFAELFPTLWEHRLEQYYPVNPGGINQQYLFNLSKEAGEYLLREGTDRAGEYSGIAEAEADVLDRLGEGPDSGDWLAGDLMNLAIEDWTDILERNDLVEGRVRPDDYETLNEIKKTFERNEDRLSKMAITSGAGKLGDCSPPQVLFIVLVRELQRVAGISERRVNLNHVKFPHILNETYHSEETIDPVDEQPADAPELQRQILEKKQLVFHGPPGTGKTYNAKQFARWWLHQHDEKPHVDQLEEVTFHPSFTYEDFIEGLEAKETEGAVQYRVEPGVFQRFVDKAKHAFEQTDGRESAPPFVMIIDEINRGNLAQIFGETITLFEHDKRIGKENETIVRLPHSGDRFGIPPNVFVIGTMNTADRSIALVDAALRRRFRFVHFPPSIDLLCETYGFHDIAGARSAASSDNNSARQLLAISICALEVLNDQIRASPDLGRGKQLGHTTLLGIDTDQAPEVQIQAILDRWKYEIMPMLEEYYFGQFDRINDELFQGRGQRLFDTEAEEIQNFTAEELAAACGTLIPDVEVDWSLSLESSD